MENSHILVKSMLILVVLLFSTYPKADNNIEFLDKKIIKNLNFSVFEVVVPKIESKKITYARELPFHTLSFRERNEKYHSIGTAFFINKKELMSAAHVFNLEYFSLLNDYYIRDTEGRIFRIGQIKKYSTIRDMAIFELETYPSKSIPLEFSKNTEIGDTVFSVGNAQGEGISFRAGQVASFTREPEYGEWKDIRFTSPASPGNSGGPLIDINGKVVGLIIKKNSSENYNVAVPITEVENLNNKAKFHIRNISLSLNNDQNNITKDWSHEVDLPGSIQEISESAQNSLNNIYMGISSELTRKYDELHFPKGERFRAYLRNQLYVKQFGALRSDADFNSWTLSYHASKATPISEEQNIVISKSDLSTFHVVIEKPEKLSLVDFLEDPKTVMDNMLKVVPLTRKVGKEKIRLLSLGEPENEEIWEDKLGRKWMSSKWFLPYIDSFVYSHCLAYPKGVICNIDMNHNRILKAGYLGIIKEDFNEITIGYEGELEDWQEYLALGKKYLPRIFNGSSITLDEDSMIVLLQDYSINFTDSSIKNKSNLHFHFGYSNKVLYEEDLLLFELFPKKGIDSHYRVQKYFSPSKFNSDEYRARWDEISNKTGDFTGEIVDKNKSIVIHKVMSKTKKSITSITDDEYKKVFVVTCYFRTSEQENAVPACDNFDNSVSFLQ